MKALALATIITLGTAVSASAETFSDARIVSGLSSVSAEAQADLSTCLSPESSSRAVRACTKALRAVAPNDDVRAHLYTRRALHRMALGRFDDASGDFTRAGELRGDTGLAAVGEGFAAMMEDDLSTAQMRFEDCSGESSVAPLAAYGLGLTHQKAGNADQARHAYQQALTLRPGWNAVSEQMETLETR